MSLEPTVVFPPPTAGPLPVIERANLNTPYWLNAGGGGVSTIGPTLALSSLTVSSINGIGGDLVLNAVGGIVVDGPGFGIQFPTDGEIDFQDSLGSLVGVSSINGAAYPPAAGGGPNPVVSTLTMGIPGGITAISSLESVGGVLPVIGGVSVSSISVSSINGAAYIPASLKMATGVSALDAGGSTIIETDTIFLVTDPVPQVTYKGAVGPGVSSLGAEALSPSTFIVYGAPNLNINWFAAGS